MILQSIILFQEIRNKWFGFDWIPLKWKWQARDLAYKSKATLERNQLSLTEVQCSSNCSIHFFPTNFGSIRNGNHGITWRLVQQRSESKAQNWRVAVSGDRVSTRSRPSDRMRCRNCESNRQITQQWPWRFGYTRGVESFVPARTEGVQRGQTQRPQSPSCSQQSKQNDSASERLLVTQRNVGTRPVEPNLEYFVIYLSLYNFIRHVWENYCVHLTSLVCCVISINRKCWFHFV